MLQTLRNPFATPGDEKQETAPTWSAGEFCCFAFLPSALIRSPGEAQLISDKPNQTRLRHLNPLTHQWLQSGGFWRPPSPHCQVQLTLVSSLLLHDTEHAVATFLLAFYHINEKVKSYCICDFAEKNVDNFYFERWCIFIAIPSCLPLGPAAQEVADTFAIISLFSPVTKLHRQLSMSANQIRDSLWVQVCAARLSSRR